MGPLDPDRAYSDQSELVATTVKFGPAGSEPNVFCIVQLR